MPTGEIDAVLVRSLRKIERAVLAEVRLPRASKIGISIAVTVLLCASIGTWASAVAGHDCPLAGVAVGVGLAATAASTLALLRPRFAPCWAAAAISGIGFPLTVFGYWALQTANNGQSCPWLLFAAAGHAFLVAQWVRCGLPAVPQPTREQSSPPRR